MSKILTDKEMEELERRSAKSAPAPADVSGAKAGFISDADMAAMEANPVSKTESAARGFAQEASFGLADEATAGVTSLVEMARRKVTGESGSFGKTYDKNLAESRANYKEAEKANPKSYLAGQAGGTLASIAIPGGSVLRGAKLGSAVVRGIGTGAAIGGLSTLGNSESRGTDLAKETLAGIAIGGALGGTAGVAKVGINKLANKAADASLKLPAEALKILAEQGTTSKGRAVAKLSKGIAGTAIGGYIGESIGGTTGAVIGAGVGGGLGGKGSIGGQIGDIVKLAGSSKVAQKALAKLFQLAGDRPAKMTEAATKVLNEATEDFIEKGGSRELANKVANRARNK